MQDEVGIARLKFVDSSAEAIRGGNLMVKKLENE